MGVGEAKENAKICPAQAGVILDYTSKVKNYINLSRASGGDPTNLI